MIGTGEIRRKAAPDARGGGGEGGRKRGFKSGLNRCFKVCSLPNILCSKCLGFYLNLVSPDRKNLLRSNRSVNLPLPQPMTLRITIIFKPDSLQLTLLVLWRCLRMNFRRVDQNFGGLAKYLGLEQQKAAGNGEAKRRGSPRWAVNHKR